MTAVSKIPDYSLKCSQSQFLTRRELNECMSDLVGYALIHVLRAVFNLNHCASLYFSCFARILGECMVNLHNFQYSVQHLKLTQSSSANATSFENHVSSPTQSDACIVNSENEKKCLDWAFFYDDIVFYDTLYNSLCYMPA